MKLKHTRQTSTLFYTSVICTLLFTCLSFVLDGWSDSEHVSQYVGTGVVLQYTLMAFFMLLLWYSFHEHHHQQLVVLFTVAVIARVAIVFVDPYSSNDVSRYLFDGKIAIEGYDPYTIAHDAPFLENLKNIWQPPPEHAKYVTLYPPLALGLFSFAASFGVDLAVTVWKIMTTITSLFVLVIGYYLLKNTRRLRHFPLLAFSPILILEAGEAAHIDIFSGLAIVSPFWRPCSRQILGLPNIRNQRQAGEEGGGRHQKEEPQTKAKQ